MLEAFFTGMVNPFLPSVFPWMLFGTVLGLFLGVIPGLSTFTLLPVLLPFLFFLPPTEGLTFIMSATTGGATSGAVTAVLFNIPGTIVSAPTVIDGYPMTKRGQGGKAVGIAVGASGIAGVLGGLLVLPLVPILRPLILAFRAPEFFLMILTGLVFLGVLSRGNLMRGLIPGFLGILVSLIGFHDISGEYRLTKGYTYLFDGLPMVPVFLALFAIPQVIEMGVMRPLEQSATPKLTGMMEGLLYTLKQWWLLLRCTLIGVWIGIVPAIGPVTGSWVAYGHAKQTSKRSDEFGSGCEEGVLAPEAANNATQGGDLLCTLAFGVPGSPTMALLIGAFWLVGIVPGPGMLYNEMELSFTMLWTVIWSNLLGTTITWICSGWIARLAYVNPHLMIPPILTMTFVGSYVATEEMMNFAVLFAIGAVGYMMDRADYNRPAFTLGFVMGAMGERYFLQAYNAFGPGFLFTSWLSVLLILIVVATLFYDPLAKGVRRLWTKELGAYEG